MSENTSNSSGVTHLRHKIQRYKHASAKMSKLGKKIEHSTLTIPLDKALEIVETNKSNKVATSSALALLEELESLLGMGFEHYSPTKLRSVCKRALFHVKNIKS